jgi:hypothetical protein
MAQEEVTKDDDASHPYQLWISRLTKLLDSDILPTSTQKPAEVIMGNFALLFCQKVRRNFFLFQQGISFHTSI